MINNMKTDTESNFTDETNQDSSENQDDLVRTADPIPKLPRRRPLPPVPNDVLVKTINDNVPLDSLDLQKQPDLPVDLKQSEQNSNLLHHEVKIKQETQDINHLGEQKD
ncbi:unnamed protein product [Hanseniaspora opuntiae]